MLDVAGFFKKVGEEIEKTIEAVKPMDPQGLSGERVAEIQEEEQTERAREEDAEQD